jgi:hypothetical protein
MVNIRVGQNIVLGASVSDFCGTYERGIFINDVGIDRSIAIRPPGCLNVSGITIEFKLVSQSGSSECNRCSPGTLYRSLGTTTTGIDGLATKGYFVTQDDLNSYNDAIGKGTSLKIMACITGSRGQTVIKSGCTEEVVIEEPIPIIPPPVEVATHYLDIYVKPYSWYSPSGAASGVVTKLGDITGKLSNLFAEVTDYRYLGTEVLTLENNVIVRIHLKQLSMASMAAPLLAYIAAIVAVVFVIIFFVGVITGWKFTLAGFIEQITGKEFSKKDVAGIIWDTVIPAQTSECEKNYPNDPIGQAQCKKSAICGAANGGTDALGLEGTDCATLGINEKIDACTAQYNIDRDMAKYKICIDGIAKDTGTETKAKTPKEGADIMTILLFGGFILGGLYIVSRAPAFGPPRKVPEYSPEYPPLTKRVAIAISRRG